MSDITLESLIQEHKALIDTMWQNRYSYYFKNTQSYEYWLAKTRRYLSTYFSNDKQVVEFDSISRRVLSKTQQQQMLAILEALTLLPNPIPIAKAKAKNIAKTDMNITINNTNSQSQSQEQSLAVELFIEAIKDDLTGRQIKELKSIVAEADNDLQKARSGILAKLKEFGADVASNIVANLLTNPMIWGGL